MPTCIEENYRCKKSAVGALSHKRAEALLEGQAGLSAKALPATLSAALSALGVPAASEKADLLLAYMRLVLERNKSVNLTAIAGEAEFVAKHLIDSVCCYGHSAITSAKSVIDIGTGGGFPGVPLAICYPDKEFALIDSLGKRVSFITEACAKLEIENVRAMHARAEDAGRDPALRESFGLAVSRAVAHLSVLCEYCLPLIKPGGTFYAYKSETQTNEIEESKNARRLLGASESAEILQDGSGESGAALDTTRDVTHVAAHAADEHNTQAKDIPPRHIIIAIRKERTTPKPYPRRPGAPSKTPL